MSEPRPLISLAAELIVPISFHGPAARIVPGTGSAGLHAAAAADALAVLPDDWTDGQPAPALALP